MISIFLQAIHSRRKVSVTFFSKEDNQAITRICAPLDYGPSRRWQGSEDSRFHLWDFTSDVAPHVVSLQPDQIQHMELLEEFFNPGDFMTWQPDWILHREWGRYSEKNTDRSIFPSVLAAA
jgi:hypothetical protein